MRSLRGKGRSKLLLLGTLVLGLIPLAAGPAGAAAAPFCNTAPITIPVIEEFPPQPGIPYPSGISVSGLTGTVSDVNLHLNDFSLVEGEAPPAYSSDIDLLLVGPTGAKIIPFSDLGDDNADAPPPIPPTAPLDFVVDDQAANALPGDDPLQSGTFRPTNDNDDADEIVPVDEFPAPAPAGVAGTALSTFNGTNPNGSWSLYVVDDFSGEQTAQFAGGWCVDVTTGSEPPGDAAPPADFDGDGDSDASVYRPANSFWFVNGGTVAQFGTTADIPVPADYDGDSDVDIAVFRPSNGFWFVRNGAVAQFGASGDIPVPADYDGDGDAEFAVFRPSNGLWFVNGGAVTQFGASGDIPVPGDYDGDGDAEIAVFRSSTGFWFVNGGTVAQFGTGGDIPVPGDYDGNGTTDIAVFRPSNGFWFVRNGAVAQFGASGDIPVPGDYDNDGDVEFAVFRPSNGLWYLSSNGVIPFGTSGDVPAPLPDAIRRFFFPPL